MEENKNEEQKVQDELVAEQVKPEEEEKTRVSPGVKSAYEYVETFCVALSVLILLFLFVFRYASVDGDSMLPTLHGNDSSDHADKLIISNLFYEPQTGDIVVLNTSFREQPLIKRVIAVGGQKVRIDFKNWEVTVDGQTLQEDYTNYLEGSYMASGNMASMYGIDENGICEFTVKEGKVFVMGDNRNNSTDSRFSGVGEQDVGNIIGKVILRIYPFSEFGTVKNG